MKSRLNTPVWGSLRSPNYTLHTEHAYCLSYRFLNNVVITTVIEMVEMVEILDGRLGQRSVERVRYVINNLLHLVIVKYGDISLVICISTRLRLVTILSLLVKYLVIYHADPCNKSYIYNWASEASPTLWCSIEISRDICIGYTIARSGLCAHNPRVSMYTQGEAEGFTRKSGL